MDMLHMLDVPDRRTGASPGARKTILSYRYFIRVQWFVNRRTQHGLTLILLMWRIWWAHNHARK